MFLHLRILLHSLRNVHQYPWSIHHRTSRNNRSRKNQIRAHIYPPRHRRYHGFLSQWSFRWEDGSPFSLYYRMYYLSNFWIFNVFGYKFLFAYDYIIYLWFRLWILWSTRKLISSICKQRRKPRPLDPTPPSRIRDRSNYKSIFSSTIRLFCYVFLFIF